MDTDALKQHCEAFILKHEITCSEAIYQMDEVILDATTFIEGVCGILGYHEFDDD